MREPASIMRHEAAVPDDGPMTFALFVLAHAGCGDGVLEVRVGERCLLEWCPACAVGRTFVFRESPPDGTSP